MPLSPPSLPRLVLAGLGHAHLFVLEAARRGRLPPCQLVVCTADERHAYSGMIPGWLAGTYGAGEVTVDVADLVARAGGVVYPANVTRLDPARRELTLCDGTVVGYDACSIAAGSVAVPPTVPGAAAYALRTRPWPEALALTARLNALAATGGRVVVVGGGLAGTEVALAIRTRLPRADMEVRLVTAEHALAADRHPALGVRLAAVCRRRQVQVETETAVTRVDASRVWLRDARGARSEGADAVVWVAGGTAPHWLRASGLPVDARGYLLVDQALCSPADPRVFAAGDSAALQHAPWTPKAGVYAVRMGPVLVASLARALGAPGAPARYRPQRRFLALVNTGDGRAVASFGPWVAEGAWVMRWKGAIDRRFVRRFAER